MTIAQMISMESAGGCGQGLASPRSMGDTAILAPIHAVTVSTTREDADILIAIFNRLFSRRYQTRLVAGDGEPLYLPKGPGEPFHRVVFAHGYFSSALHETAHWCIAGKRRRLSRDYGYWYLPDGRDPAQQREFERVETKPQALEWIFSAACGHRFTLSRDNLNGQAAQSPSFPTAVSRQVEVYLRDGLPNRAQRFHRALRAFYRRGEDPLPSTPYQAG